MDYANPTAKLRNYYKILTIKHILRSRADAFYRISPLLSHLRPNQARYSLLISLDSNFRTASDDQWNSFYRDYACIQAQSIFCRLGYMPQYLIRSQDLTLISVADAHGREHPMNQHKPKVASYSIPFHRGYLLVNERSPDATRSSTICLRNTLIRGCTLKPNLTVTKKIASFTIVSTE